MKLINETSCGISVYIFHGILHLNISHKEKCWLGGTSYRGGGKWSFEYRDSTHFEMYDDYDPTGEKEIDESDFSKYKEFCLIPENDEEQQLLSGSWFRNQNKETETFVCFPYSKTLEELHSITDIPLTNP